MLHTNSKSKAVAALLLLVTFCTPQSNVSAANVERNSQQSSAESESKREARAEYWIGAVAAWLSANFDLPARGEPPHVEFVPNERMAALRFGSVPLDRRREVVAVYHDAKRTIFLSQGWEGRAPAEVSVLVHELVHHLQNLDGKIFACAEAREYMAYDAQDQWLKLAGRNLESEFGLDAMTLKVMSACM